MGGGEEEHVKIVHMGKGKPWSVATCNLVHDFDHLLEEMSHEALVWRLGCPIDRFSQGRGSLLVLCLPSQV